MKKITALILACLMLFTFAACGGNGGGEVTEPTSNQAAEVDGDLAYIKDKGTLVVGITDYAPMDFKDDKGEWTGFDAEFARLAGEKLGVKVEFIEIDWDNKFFELDAKSIDCIWNGMTITTEAKENASVSNAYVKNAQVVVMKSADLAAYATAESLADLSFAVEAGSAGEAAAKENSYDFTAVLTQADALKEVKSGAADACIIDITMADAMTGEGTSYANLGYSLELTSEEYGIACREGSNLTDALNNIMAELKADGTLQGLAEKYELTLA